MIIQRIKSWLFGNNSVTSPSIITQSISTSSIEITSTNTMPITKSFLSYRKQVKCKTHWEYQGLSVPTNNCNDCWEMYSQRGKRL